jgi:hypothetical protein
VRSAAHKVSSRFGLLTILIPLTRGAAFAENIDPGHDRSKFTWAENFGWDTTRAPTSRTGTGQDGALKRRAATPPRFTDNANGTVKDNLTGSTWLKNASCFDSRTWTNVLSDANSLASGGCGLTDGWVAGDWRLPNLRELQSLMDYGQVSPALPVGHPFTGALNVNYWTSTTQAAVRSYAWNVKIDDDFVPNYDKTFVLYVWPVRGGP